MASIRKRRNKWHVQVRRSRQQSLTRSFTHKADAEAWARKTERDIDTGEIRAVADQLKTTTVGELLRRYRREVMINKRGADVEAYIVDRFLRDRVASLSLARLSGRDISRYRDDRLKAVKSGTVHRELAVLRHCFEVARKDWAIPLKSNPVAEITMPALGKPRNRRPRAAELSALELACSHPLLWQIVTIAIETGMRRGEIVNMKWADIDWDHGTLHIPLTKNGHPRTIPLTQVALDTLAGLSTNDDRVFPMSGNAIRLSWERLKKKAGVTNLRFHDLRHEAVSRFFEMGLSVPEVALISGHRDLRMLHRYTHLKAETVGEKIRMLTSPDASVSPSDLPLFTGPV